MLHPNNARSTETLGDGDILSRLADRVANIEDPGTREFVGYAITAGILVTCALVAYGIIELGERFIKQQEQQDQA